MSTNHERVFLPSDICFHITQFLPWKQIITCCSLISKQWHSEVIKSKLYDMINVKGSWFVELFRSESFILKNIQSLSFIVENKGELMEFCENLSKMKSLKILTLNSATNLPNVRNELIQLFKCKELEQLIELSLSFLGFEDKGLDYSVASEIETCPHIGNLTKLSIWAEITKNGVGKVASNPRLSKLKEFTFFNTIGEEELRIIYENMKYLQKISVNNTNPNCFKIITQMKEIQEIYVRYGHINLKDIDTEIMSNLKKISLNHVSFSDLNSIKLLGTSTHLKNLSCLSLKQGLFKINLNIEDWNELFSGHLSNNLRQLSLSVDLPRNILGSISKHLKNLTYLYIESRELLDDKSTREFVENLEGESLLTKLHISSIDITDLSIEYLCNCCYLTRLESLSLKKTRLLSLKSIDMIASSQFSNTISSLEYFLDYDDSQIQIRINNLKKKGKLLNLTQFPKKSGKTTNNNLKRLDRGQQTLTSLVKKKKQ